MATPEDLRVLALSFEGVVEGEGEQLGYSVMVKGKAKGLCWEWRERVEPKKPKRTNPGVYAFRTDGLAMKEALLQDPAWQGKLFTEDHYNGYPAVLCRLEACSEDELRELFEDGYRLLRPV